MPAHVDVVVVEDDKALAGLVSDYLLSQGLQVWVEHDGLAGEASVLSHRPRLAIVDLMLPGLDGVSLCRRLRPLFDGALLVLTASDDEFDHVAALEAGADDYVCKPIKPRVLLARIRALLRRVDSADTGVSASLRVGTLEVQPLRRRALLEGVELGLTSSEFDLLVLLARHAGEVVDRETLSVQLRGLPYDGTDRSIDLRASRLRRALGAHPNGGEWIRGVRGQGYMLRGQDLQR
jgi:two-component system response regulator RstA